MGLNYMGASQNWVYFLAGHHHYENSRIWGSMLGSSSLGGSYKYQIGGRNQILSILDSGEKYTETTVPWVLPAPVNGL